MSEDHPRPDETRSDRTRTYTWSDPSGWLPATAGLSGKEVLQAMASGELPQPPIAGTLGYETMEVDDGRITVTLLAQEFHYNPIGVVHGGVIATLLDTAAACAVLTMLGPGEAYTSLDLNVKFLRAVTVESGRVRAEGQVLHRGGRTAVAEASLFDEGDRLLAHATSTMILFRPAR